jgi:uncharacterized protein (DUF1330 family)
MTAIHRTGVGLALLAGVLLGAAGIGGIQAQGRPQAYVVIDISETKDSNAYIKAVSAAEPSATESAGGRFLIRTNAPTALDGEAPNRFVVISFDSAEKAKSWYNSQAIKDLNDVRMSVTTSRSFMVEGLKN